MEFKNGALIDTRTEEQKQKDYNIKEIVASVAVVDWKEKPESEWRKLTAEGKFLYNNYIRDPALIISEEEEPPADNLVMMHLIAQAGGLM